MARIRSIHPGFFTDEDIVGMSPLARLLLVGIWGECDDQGMFLWKPATLKMRVLPMDAVDCSGLLMEMVGAGCVRRYQLGDKDYGAIKNFRRFQHPERPNAVHPMTPEIAAYVGLPAPSHSGSAKKAPPYGGNGSTKGTRTRRKQSRRVDEQAPTIAEPTATIAEPSSTEQPASVASRQKLGQMEKEREGREGETLPNSTSESTISTTSLKFADSGAGATRTRTRGAAARATAVCGFEDFWAAYPAKEGKGAAEKAFAKALKVAPIEAIAAGLNAQLEAGKWGNPMRYVPNPATWLNERRWQDDPNPRPGANVVSMTPMQARVAASDATMREHLEKIERDKATRQQAMELK